MADTGVMTVLPCRDPSLQSAATVTALHLPEGRGTSKSSHHRSPMLAQQRAPRKAAIGVPVTPAGGQQPGSSRSTAHIRKTSRPAVAVCTAAAGPAHPC
jgi:hypothetical protein